MPINAHPDFLAAQKEYLTAQTLEDRILKLQKMISVAPTHKGAENLRAQLKTRLKKLKEQLVKNKKSGKSSKIGIKKEDIQAVLVGLTNTGKSRLLTELTNAHPKIGSEFEENTTKKPIIGMMDFFGSRIQLIENPAINSPNYDKGITNSADTLLLFVTDLEQIKKIEKEIGNSTGKKIIVFVDQNSKDISLRKISATLQSRKYNFVIINLETKKGLEELKFKLFRSFNKIRVYTKEPGKEPDKNKPLILEPASKVKHAAKKIIKGLDKLKETRIWGPSSKFPGQIVGLNHELKDLDVIEFKTK
jgi:hypothetical protein